MKNLTLLILLIHAPSLFFPTTFESVNHPELNEVRFDQKCQSGLRISKRVPLRREMCPVQVRLLNLNPQ